MLRLLVRVSCHCNFSGRGVKGCLFSENSFILVGPSVPYPGATFGGKFGGQKTWIFGNIALMEITKKLFCRNFISRTDHRMHRQPVWVWQSVSCSLDRRLHLSWGGTGVQTGLWQDPLDEVCYEGNKWRHSCHLSLAHVMNITRCLRNLSPKFDFFLLQKNGLDDNHVMNCNT